MHDEPKPRKSEHLALAQAASVRALRAKSAARRKVLDDAVIAQFERGEGSDRSDGTIADELKRKGFSTYERRTTIKFVKAIRDTQPKR